MTTAPRRARIYTAIYRKRTGSEHNMTPAAPRSLIPTHSIRRQFFWLLPHRKKANGFAGVLESRVSADFDLRQQTRNVALVLV